MGRKKRIPLGKRALKMSRRKMLMMRWKKVRSQPTDQQHYLINKDVIQEPPSEPSQIECTQIATTPCKTERIEPTDVKTDVKEEAIEEITFECNFQLKQELTLNSAGSPKPIEEPPFAERGDRIQETDYQATILNQPRIESSDGCCEPLETVFVDEIPLAEGRDIMQEANYQFVPSQLMMGIPSNQPRIEEHNSVRTFCFIPKDLIVDLQARPFRSRPLLEQINIVERDRPLFENSSSSKPTSWLCKSTILNKIFCWPCAIFSVDIKFAEIPYGLAPLASVKEIHDTSTNHLQAITDLHIFTQRYANKKINKNEEIIRNVKQNRRILKRMIDAICFLVNQDLTFQSTCKAECFRNNELNFVEFSNYFKIYDPFLIQGFKAAYSSFRNLYNAITEVMNNYLMEELRDVRFISVVFNRRASSYNTSNALLFLMVVRYIKNTTVKELVLDFNTEPTMTNDSLFDANQIIEKYKLEHKMVAYTSDIPDVQINFKNKYPQAVYSYCYYYPPDVTELLFQSLYNIPGCSSFLNSMKNILNFSSKEKTSLLQFLHSEISDFKTPTLISEQIETILKYKDIFIKYFTLNKEQSSEDETTAKNFIEYLNNIKIIFVTHLLYPIFRISDKITKLLQLKNIFIGDIVLQIDLLKEIIDDYKRGFKICKNCRKNISNKEDINNCTRKYDCNDCEEFGFLSVCRSAKISFNPGTNNRQNCYNLYIIIITYFSNNVASLSKLFTDLLFFDLLNARNFFFYCLNFPSYLFSILMNQYKNTFNREVLINELKIIYSNPVFHKPTLLELLKYLKDENLDETFREVCLLCELLLTIPAVPLPSNPSVLARIDEYKKTDFSVELKILSIRRDILNTLREHNDFYKNIIQIFDEKEKLSKIINNCMHE